MDYQKLLSDDLIKRTLRLQKSMQETGLEACLLTTSVNILYMAGRIYNGYCYIPGEGDIIHFVKRPDGISFPNTVYIRKPEQITEELQARNISLPKNILLEVDVVSYNECSRLLKIFGLSEAFNASVLMRRLRSVKTEFEISQIRLSAHKHVTVYKLIPSVFRKGMTDIEFQAEIERLMRFHGSHGVFQSYGEFMNIYMGSLLTGENAEVPSPFDFALGGAGISPILPLGASGQKIKQGQTIMVDMAGNYTPWMTDMTRVFSLGKTLEIAYRAHQVSIDIHNHIMDIFEPNMECSKLYNIAYEMVRRANLEPYFMGTKQQAKFVGHGLGLEINEPPVLTPRSKELLEPNIVFALEPKFVIPEVGAVGIENTYLVTQDGIEKLTILDEDIIEL